MKYYIYRSWKNKHRGKIEYLPLGIVLSFGWGKYNFKYCQIEEYYPFVPHEGKHYFSIDFGIFYWAIKIAFYKPEKYEQT